MVLRLRSVAIAACALAGCAAGTDRNVTQAQNACNAGASHAEMRDGGTIVRVLGVRRTYSGDHEGFLIALGGASRVYKVEDNIDITGYIPLHRGQLVELAGQYECDDGVIHWTHRDPSGRHPAGYIKVDGKIYQ